MAILYVASEAGELKPFAARLGETRKLAWPLEYAQEGVLHDRRLLLVAHGAGPALASRAVEVAIRAITAAELSSSRLEAIISTGFCGSLAESLAIGDVIAATEVLASDTGLRFACRAQPQQPATLAGVVISQDRIAGTQAEKVGLQSTGAIAVEMEAGGVALRAERAGVPFGCIKVVSDTLQQSFSLDLNAMRAADGRLARGKIIGYTSTRPWLIPELLRLRRSANLAAEALGEFLVRCSIEFGPSSREPESMVSS